MKDNRTHNSITTWAKKVNWDEPFTKREILIYDAVVLGAYAVFLGAYCAKNAYDNYKTRKRLAQMRINNPFTEDR